MKPAVEIGFNSATAVMPWRFNIEIPIELDTDSLQFGHGCDAVEMVLATTGATSTRVLQFGHGCDAVEIILPVSAAAWIIGASIRPRL